MKRNLYLEIAGFLNVLALGIVPRNLPEQAKDLLDKVGAAIAEEYPELVETEEREPRS